MPRRQSPRTRSRRPLPTRHSAIVRTVAGAAQGDSCSESRHPATNLAFRGKREAGRDGHDHPGQGRSAGDEEVRRLHVGVSRKVGAFRHVSGRRGSFGSEIVATESYNPLRPANRRAPLCALLPRGDSMKDRRAFRTGALLLCAALATGCAGYRASEPSCEPASAGVINSTG